MEYPFHCPGDTQGISRSVHLARLASFYPPCRTCPHRDETGTLAPRRVAQLQETRRRAAAHEWIADEAIVGIELNEIVPSIARRAGAALSVMLREERSEREVRTRVGVANDGRPVAAELVAAVIEGLRTCGCDVFDMGVTTSGGLTRAIWDLELDGAVYIGNSPGERRTVSLKFWESAARPISRENGLGAIADSLDDQIFKPMGVAFGGLRRGPGHSDDVQRFADRFHALRPFRIALDTACLPLRRALEQSLESSGCRVHAPECGGWAARSSADFSIWIDGDGEVCRLADESGEVIAGERLLLAIAGHRMAESSSKTPKPVVVVEKGAPASVRRNLALLGARVVLSESSRSAMDAAMRRHKGLIGGGPSGRFWFGHRPPLADALELIADLLALLSRSDLPLSEVVPSILEASPRRSAS